jgi:hypothetical protein
MYLEKTLSFNEVLTKTETIRKHSVFVKELDGSIPYCDLTVEDFIEITKNKNEDNTELNVKIFFKAWHHADPRVTLEAVRTKIPLPIILKIVKEIVPGLVQTVPLGNSPAPK